MSSTVPADAARRVTAVVLVDGEADPARCLAALAAARPAPGELVLVDATGAGGRAGLALPAGLAPRTVRADPAAGRAAALNAGAAQASAEAAQLLFLHAAVEPEPDFLAPLLEAAAAPATGVVGLRLLLPSGATCHGWRLAWASPYPVSAVPVADLGPLVGAGSALEVPAASGAAMAVDAALFRELGGFDPGFWNGLEDVDLCLRAAAAGRGVVVACGSRGRHHGGGAPPRPGHANEARLSRRWLGRVPLQDVKRLRGAARQPPRDGRPPISVVVPLADAVHRVAPALEGQRQALGPGDQLVLADAGSTDGTAEYAALLARDAPGAVTVVSSPREAGLAGAITAGLAAATHPTAALLHLPDEPAPGLLDEATQLLRDNPGLAFFAFPAPPLGVCAVGEAAALRSLVHDQPAAFLAAGTAELEAAATAAGVAAAFMG